MKNAGGHFHPVKVVSLKRYGVVNLPGFSIVVNNLNFMDAASEWKNLSSVIRIETERITKITGKVENNIRYYISSLSSNACAFNKHIRNHWAIENNLHWVLDEVFNEDKSRRRKGKSPENFSIVAKMAMVLLKRARTKHLSITAMRAQAGWKDDFRESLLNFK